MERESLNQWKARQAAAGQKRVARTRAKKLWRQLRAEGWTLKELRELDTPESWQRYLKRGKPRVTKAMLAEIPAYLHSEIGKHDGHVGVEDLPPSRKVVRGLLAGLRASKSSKSSKRM
jgi:hypothetical protein